MLRYCDESPSQAASSRTASLPVGTMRRLGTRSILVLAALTSGCVAFEDPSAVERPPASGIKRDSGSQPDPTTPLDAAMSQSTPSATPSFTTDPLSSSGLADAAVYLDAADDADASFTLDASTTASGNPLDASIIPPVADTGVDSAVVVEAGPVDAGPPMEWSHGLPVPLKEGVVRPSGTPGNLKILNWAGFKAAVSYTFDDSNSSQIQHYDELNALGVPFTFYLQTGKSESTNAVWGQALIDGHELGNHTKNHAETDEDGADTDEATAFIEDTWGVTPYSLAAPYGAEVYATIASTRFLTNRNVNDDQVAPNAGNPFALPCYLPGKLTKANIFNNKIDTAVTAGRWQIVLVHGFSGGSDGAYNPIDLAQFEEAVEYAKSGRNVWIDTMVAVGAYWRGQRMLKDVDPVVGEEGTVWSWTLPDNFPTGKYLRVTVDGGTLSQNGQPLPWSEHGYYEVELDVGSLILSP